MTICSKPGCYNAATWRNQKATRFGCDDHKLELVTPTIIGAERSNYVELLESEVRRLQAEVTRLTRREDSGDSAIIAGLVAAARDGLREIAWIQSCNGYAESEPELWLTSRLESMKANMRSAISKAGGS